jgi:hypothetical protein
MKPDTFTVAINDILFCFRYYMHVFIKAQSYFLDKLQDNWVRKGEKKVTNFT